MPLVVMFKSESDGPDKFVNVLEESNFDVRPICCLNFQFKNLDRLRAELNNAEDYEGLIFTSPRSVHAAQKACDTQTEIVSPWSNKNNYCVGESTNELARSLLNLETLGKESGNAQNLASLIVDIHSKCPVLKPFLFPSGNLKQEVLETALQEHSIDVQCLEVYETIQHPDLRKSIEDLEPLKIDFIVYFSPSGVKFSLPILRSLEIDLQNCKIVAIGPSTRKCLEENNLQCYKMCSKPTPESLLEILS